MALRKQGRTIRALQVLEQGPMTVGTFRAALDLSSRAGTALVTYLRKFDLVEPSGLREGHSIVWQLTKKARRMLEAEAEPQITEPHEVVPERTWCSIYTNAAPDRPLPVRADAYDFLRCHSRRGEALVPMSQLHHDPR